MRWIYLSPHLDDAVYSCGGIMVDQVRAGERVENWTVFAGDPPEGPLSPFAETLHAQWGCSREAMAERRQEDVTACRLVGAAHRHFSFIDAIYRQESGGEWLYNPETLMGELHAADGWLVEELCEFLSLLLRQDDLLLCPLSVGGHVDHRLVRKVAEKLSAPILFYADFPYILNQPDQPKFLAGAAQAEIWPVSAQGLRSWQDGVAAYATQISTYWPDVKKMRQAVKRYGQGGISVWK